jgi:hypothetical protein
MRGGVSVGDTTRVLSITMSFKTETSQEKRNNPHHNLCLTSIYFPHSGYKDLELEAFQSKLSSHLSTIVVYKNTTHIIGADTNSSIGTRKSPCKISPYSGKHKSHLDTDPILQLLGPHENP